MPPTSPLEPQAALETAVRDLVRTRLHYPAGVCGRTFDEHPPPFAGPHYVGVWSPADRDSSQRACLDERLGLRVTLTLRVNVPYDRKVELRDELERRLNAIRALLHQDSDSWLVIQEANKLAALAYAAGAGVRGVGFCEGLMFEGFDSVQEVGGEWFQGQSQKPQVTGIQQTARFGRARRVQATPTAS